MNEDTQIYNHAKFTASSLLKDEKILYAAQWSYVYVWLFAIIGLIYSIITYATAYGIPFGAFFIILIIVALITTLLYFSIKKSELVITNYRIILKKGIILRKTFELPVDKWESLSVNETLLGKLCGYGFVKICGTGASSGIAGPIKNPFEIRGHFAKIKVNDDSFPSPAQEQSNEVQDATPNLIKEKKDESMALYEPSHISASHTETSKPTKDKSNTLWIIIGVVLAVFIVLIICYSSFRNGDDNAKAEYLLLDTQATKDAQWTTDSIKMVERVTPDLAFFELHGPVKTLKCGTYETHTYKFDEEGNLEKIDGYNPFTVDIYSSGYENPIRYSRNSRGQITEEQGWESQRIYTWNGEHLSRSEGGAEGYSSTISYHYDGRGFMTYEDCNSEWYGGEECETYHISYTYIEIDHYGNWVERTAVYSNGRRETERRKIEYFPITRY